MLFMLQLINYYNGLVDEPVIIVPSVFLSLVFSRQASRHIHNVDVVRCGGVRIPT